MIVGVGETPWRRRWQPTPGFLPGESHGQRSLAGYSPWGRKSRTRQLTKPPPPSLAAQLIKNLPAMQETWVRSRGREDPLEKG